jgi:hypothetical protein
MIGIDQTTRMVRNPNQEHHHDQQQHNINQAAIGEDNDNDIYHVMFQELNDFRYQYSL